MHLHRVEGAWMHHPFWKTRFAINSVDDLKKVQARGVAECWIDAAPGSEVAPAPLLALRTGRGAAGGGRGRASPHGGFARAKCAPALCRQRHAGGGAQLTLPARVPPAGHIAKRGR